MQKDMHYYGTYAMARAAGIERESSQIIATAAQFVDDNAIKHHIEFLDGGRIDAEATAHHTFDGDNIKLDDQRKIWVPFHFLPGNEGDSYFESMVCRKNSDIAKEMVEHNLTLSSRAFGRELIGITAHVYADTFSHHGFSGFSSETNEIINDSLNIESELSAGLLSYIEKKKVRFINKIQSLAAEEASKGLGHGAVLTFPDRPYLNWSFIYENGDKQKVLRDNPRDFLEGCQALHGMFIKFRENEPMFASDDGVEFSEISSTVESILATEGKLKERVNAWKSAANKGLLFASGSEDIPDYDQAIWGEQWEALKASDDSSDALNQNIYRFYQAASTHRNYILRDLLPSHLLVAH